MTPDRRAAVMFSSIGLLSSPVRLLTINKANSTDLCSTSVVPVVPGFMRRILGFFLPASFELEQTFRGQVVEQLGSHSENY